MLRAAEFCYCVLQDSGVTPLKYREIYDTEFVAHFMEHTTAKKIENQSTLVKLMNEYIVVPFLPRCM